MRRVIAIPSSTLSADIVLGEHIIHSIAHAFLREAEQADRRNPQKHFGSWVLDLGPLLIAGVACSLSLFAWVSVATIEWTRDAATVSGERHATVAVGAAAIVTATVSVGLRIRRPTVRVWGTSLIAEAVGAYAVWMALSHP